MSSIHVCPLCGELASDSDEYGPSLWCSHKPYERVQPVEVQGEVVDGSWVFPLPNAEEWKATVGAEMLVEQEKRDRERAAWLALSCDERVAAREKRREAHPSSFIFGEIMRDQLASPLFNRQFYGQEPETVTIACPRCREVGCENTRTEPNPRYDPDAKPFSWSGGFTVQVEPGSLS